MNGHDTEAELFDVFLCHNSEDKQAVREIAQKLVKEGIKPWLDEDQIRPGTTWQTALGEQIGSIRSAAVFVGDGGLGPWQNQEMQSFLNRFVNRKCAVIPVVLASAKTDPEFPWPLENFHRIDFRTDSQPLERLVWGITGQKPPELVDVASYSEQPATMREGAGSRLISSSDKQAASDNLISETRLFPPLGEPPDPENATQLNILRKRVMEYWVDGVLRHSLYNEVLISLGKREVARAVDAPWKYTVELSDIRTSTSFDDRDLNIIYDAAGLLLILGEPGSGKTTTLLDLARTLLERAKTDIKERVAVVLNLSSWKKKQAIEEWISNELSEKYRIPRKIARFWLQSGYLLLLLDGLDEIETSMQPDCVAAINTFIEEFQPSGLVVCCRLNEYRWLPRRLKMNGAICIEPLSPEEVSKYLDAGGSKLAALREAVDTDPLMQELAETPLMLSIMSLACQGVDGHGLTGKKIFSLEERRKQIFGLYVEEMFQRKETASLVFAKEKIIGWLAWLAEKMRKHSASQFFVENLQPDWLDTARKKLLNAIALAVSCGLIGYLFCLLMGAMIIGVNTASETGLLTIPITIITCLFNGFSQSTTRNTLASIAASGLLTGAAGSAVYGRTVGFGAALLAAFWAMLVSGGTGATMRIATVERITLNWSKFWSRGLYAGAAGVALALWVGSNSGLWKKLTLVICVAAFMVTYQGLLDGIRPKLKDDKAIPNQGIHLSLRNCLKSFCAIWLGGGIIAGLLIALFMDDLHISFPHMSLIGAFIGALLSGFYFSFGAGLVCGFILGGSAMVKHCILRMVLSLSGNMPYNFVAFLDECSRLIFLKKVGGGYIFIHRMLLDYFADMAPPPTRSDKAKLVRSP